MMEYIIKAIDRGHFYSHRPHHVGSDYKMAIKHTGKNFPIPIGHIPNANRIIPDWQFFPVAQLCFFNYSRTQDLTTGTNEILFRVTISKYV